VRVPSSHPPLRHHPYKYFKIIPTIIEIQPFPTRLPIVHRRLFTRWWVGKPLLALSNLPFEQKHIQHFFPSIVTWPKNIMTQMENKAAVRFAVANVFFRTSSFEQYFS
jgi:hypothetical protein